MRSFSLIKKLQHNSYQGTLRAGLCCTLDCALGCVVLSWGGTLLTDLPLFPVHACEEHVPLLNKKGRPSGTHIDLVMSHFKVWLLHCYL